jgi:hypothetical protein
VVKKGVYRKSYFTELLTHCLPFYFNFEFVPFYITIYSAKVQLEFTQRLTFSSPAAVSYIELSTGFESAKSFQDTGYYTVGVK